MSYSFPGGFRIDIISLLTAANMLLQISKSPFLFLSTLTGNSILSHIGSNAYPKSDIKCSGQFWVETYITYANPAIGVVGHCVQPSFRVVSPTIVVGQDTEMDRPK